ncbi:unnamed protein product [Ixodes pacificus]
MAGMLWITQRLLASEHMQPQRDQPHHGHRVLQMMRILPVHGLGLTISSFHCEGRQLDDWVGPLVMRGLGRERRCVGGRWVFQFIFGENMGRLFLDFFLPLSLPHKIQVSA